MDQGYGKNLVSTQEVTQDDALKKLHSEYEAGIVQKQKMLSFCLYIFLFWIDKKCKYFMK